MDWKSLSAGFPEDPVASVRGRRLAALRRVLEGRQYDQLPYPFSKERSGAGEYIPLKNRRPSVRTHLCRTVVDDAVSLLFGDCHLPDVVVEDPEVQDALRTFATDVNLGALMMEAATRGAIGSVAILFEITQGVPRLSVLDTPFLTPVWDDVTGELRSVTERFTVSGEALRERGYELASGDRGARYIWMRRWTTTACEIYVPAVEGMDDGGVVDQARTLRHDLGFVPIVWIRNLTSLMSADQPDGECTFERAIDTVIEADYLLSQAGRGLKYSSDPTLVLKTGALGQGPVAREGGAASALTLPPEGDAKLLEINGNSANAVLAHYRELRALVLEQLHGNRSHTELMSRQTSGRALEMMNQPLIWLAERLRHSYGTGGLIPIFRMACLFSDRLKDGIRLSSGSAKSLCPGRIGLRWPPWFQADSDELKSLAESLQMAVVAEFLTTEHAARIFKGAVQLAGHRY